MIHIHQRSMKFFPFSDFGQTDCMWTRSLVNFADPGLYFTSNSFLVSAPFSVRSR